MYCYLNRFVIVRFTPILKNRPPAKQLKLIVKRSLNNAFYLIAGKSFIRKFSSDLFLCTLKNAIKHIFGNVVQVQPSTTFSKVHIIIPSVRILTA